MSSLRDVVVNHSLFTRSRIYSLYSDFAKLRDVNPDGYEANLIAWKSLVDAFFQTHSFKDTFVLKTEHLMENLTLAEYGKPLSLYLVLEELISNGELLPLQRYRSRADSIYSRHWVRPALSWAVNRFLIDTSYRVCDSKRNLKPDAFISKKTLEAYAKELELSGVFEGSSAQSKAVFSKAEFKEYLDGLDIPLGSTKSKLTDLDYEIILIYLGRDIQKIRTNEAIVKLGNEDITEQDISIVEIKSTLETLNAKTEELQNKVDVVAQKLKASLQKKNNKDVSLNLLRSKKLAEKSLATQLSLVNQLDSVLYKIDESSSNVQLLKALESGTSLLSDLNKQIGGVEKVEKLMDELEDEKYKSDEITSELHRLNPQVDDDDIEAEFEELLAKDQASKSSIKNTSEEEHDLSNKLSQLDLAPTDIEESDKKAPQKEAVLN